MERKVEPDAAVHQVAKQCAGLEGCHELEPQSELTWITCPHCHVSESWNDPVCRNIDCPSTDGPPWADPNCGSCGGSGYTSLGGCYVCQKRAVEREVDNPPDQHVAPPKTIWVSREYATNPDHHMRLLGDDVEVVPIAPIQAALERCELSTKGYVDDGDGVTVRQSDWDALVEAVKRENVNGK